MDECTACKPVPVNLQGFNKQVVLPCGLTATHVQWAFSGRSETSRRTITASVTRTGYEKMEANWLYRSE
jgi:hypothetical protein